MRHSLFAASEREAGDRRRDFAHAAQRRRIPGGGTAHRLGCLKPPMPQCAQASKAARTLHTLEANSAPWLVLSIPHKA